MTVGGIPIIYYGDEQYLAYYDDGHDTPPEDVNSDDDDPYNRPGMTRWEEDTPAFRTIKVLAELRSRSAAVQKGRYQTLYAKADVLVFARHDIAEVVLVAVNRGPGATIDLDHGVDLPPGVYRGLLEDASAVNRDNKLVVHENGSATLHLGRLSSLAVSAPR
jgi:glycosidase